MRYGLLVFWSIAFFGCTKELYTGQQFFDCVNRADFLVDSDKDQLIYCALERAVIKNRDIPDYQMIRDKQKIYINKSLYADFFKDTIASLLDVSDIPAEIGGVKFCLKSKPELQEIANRTSDFMYLSLGDIKIDTHYATIGISNNWMLSKKSINEGKVYMAGGGYVLQYYRKNDRWVYHKTAYTWTI